MNTINTILAIAVAYSASIFMSCADQSNQGPTEKTLEELFDTPINFWGLVVDQDGNPVPNANVRIYVYDKAVWADDGSNASEYNIKSDASGKVQLLDKKGASLSAKATCDGYAMAYDQQKGDLLSHVSIEYGDDTLKNYNPPTADAPSVMVLRKKGEIADLMEISSKSTAIPKDGTEAEVQLTNSTIMSQVKCWSSAPEPFNYDPYEWRAELRIKGGKLLPVKDEHAVIAPEDGYKELIKIDMIPDKMEFWIRSSPRGARDFWEKLDDGAYARLTIIVSTGLEHKVKAEGLLNLDGTNSFEQ